MALWALWIIINMIGVRFKLFERDFRQGIDGLTGKFENLSTPLKQCGLAGLRSIAKTFKAGGRPVRWKPSKRAEMQGGKTLIDTARLARSITMDAGTKSVSWGANVKYARIHQLGGTIPARTILPRRKRALRWIDPSGQVRFAKKARIPATQMPARPFLVIQDEDWRTFRRIFADYISGE